MLTLLILLAITGIAALVWWASGRALPAQAPASDQYEILAGLIANETRMRSHQPRYDSRIHLRHGSR